MNFIGCVTQRKIVINDKLDCENGIVKRIGNQNNSVFSISRVARETCGSWKGKWWICESI